MRNIKKLLVSLSILCATIVYAQPTPADSLTIVKAKWHTEKHRGIRSRHAHFTDLYGGPQDIYLLDFSLRRHPLRVQDHHGRALTTAVAAKEEALAAINGTYFDMTPQGRSVCFTASQGHVLDYTAHPLKQLSNGAVVLQGNKASIIPWDVSQEQALFPDSLATTPYADADIMVCGPLMLQDGRELPLYAQDHVLDKHPRSGIALRGHRATLIVIDGRAPGRAAGVTIAEFAHFLRILGMESALNLDGGGSSVLWTTTKGTLNTPSSKGVERAVSNALIAR